MADGCGIEAVIFDMDGVLLDSEPYWQEAEIDVFGTVGLHLERQDCRRTMGMRVDEVVAYWDDRRPWDPSRGSRQEVEGAILDGVIARIRRRGRALGGVEAALSRARRRGYRLGLASSSPARVIDAVLQALDLESEFEVAVSAEDEERGKPDPAVYLTACRRLRAAPANSVAIEDSLAGLEAAGRAGMRCIMVPDRSLADRPELDRAVMRLDSLEQLTDDVWQAVGATQRDRAGRWRGAAGLTRTNQEEVGRS